MAQQIKVNSSTGNIQIQISRGAIGPSTTANVANTALNLNAASTANVVIGGGVNGYVLSTDGAGTTSWVAQTGGGGSAPGGANTQIQYNDAGTLEGDATFTFNNTTDVVSASHFSGEAGNLSNIQGANVSGAVANATHAVDADTANAVAVANVVGIGNIATVNLDGNAANYLDGTGTWAPAGGATTPGGSNTQVQYNDNGAFGGEAVFTYDDVTDTLTAPNITATTIFEGDINGAVLLRCFNNTGSTLNKGQLVYLPGGNNGDQPYVDLADSSDINKMPAFGVVKENIAPSTSGEVVTLGELTGLNLTGFTTGDTLYVNGVGAFQNTAPTGEADFIQSVGKVIDGGTGGAIEFTGAGRVNQTPNLDDGNIFIGNATNQATTANLYGEINTHLAAFGSNTITTTGNVDTGNLTATTSLFVDGVDGNVLIQPNVAVNGNTYSSVVRGEYNTGTGNSTTSQAIVTDNYTTQGITNIQTFANTAAGALAEGPSLNFNNYAAIGNTSTDPLVAGQIQFVAYPDAANLANASTGTGTTLTMGGQNTDGFLIVQGTNAGDAYSSEVWKQFQYRPKAMGFIRRGGNADSRSSPVANDETSINFYTTQTNGGVPGQLYNWPAKMGSKVDPGWTDPNDPNKGTPEGLFFTVVSEDFANLEHRMYANGDTIFNTSGGGTPITLGYNGVITGDGGGLSNIASSNVVGLGNIATINLDGNVSNVLAGDGTFIAAGGGGGIQAQIANGTSNVDIATADGNVDVTVNGNTVMVTTDTGTVIQNEPSGNITISPTLSTAYGAGTFVSNQYNPATMGIFRRNGNSTNKTSSVANDETAIDFYNTQDRFGGTQTGVPWNYPARIGSKVDPTWVDPQDTSLGVPQGIFFTAVNDAYANIEHRMYGNGDVEFNASGGTSVTIGNNGVITGDGGGLSNVSATATPGGFFDTIQFNNGGTLDGNSSFQFIPGTTPQVQLNGTSGSQPADLALQNGVLTMYTEDLSGGKAPMSFSFHNDAVGGFVEPINYRRTRGTFAAQTAVTAGDQIKNERLQAYSGATAQFAYAGGQISTIQANDGLGNLAVTTTISTARPANGPNSLDKIDLDTEFVTVAGNIQMSNTSASFVAGRIRQITDIFANLPASPIAGERAVISDGPAYNSFGTVVSAGGGSNVMPVFWDGSNWRMG